MRKELGASSIHHGHSEPQQDMGKLPLEVHDGILALVSSALPVFEEKFDPYAYIN